MSSSWAVGVRRLLGFLGLLGLHICLKVVEIVRLGRREPFRGKTVLVHQVPVNLVEHFGPHRSLGVHTIIARFTHERKGLRVRLEAGRIRVLADTLTAVGPCTHIILRCACVVDLHAKRSGEEVTPAFTHATGLAPTETTRVFRTTVNRKNNECDTYDDAALQISVPHWFRRVPDIHTHLASLTIRRGREVGVIISRAILGVGHNSIAFFTT
ncbi:hypothetical protein BC937DRAFT_88019 [Endogone sp. FLAS-F59071]|nr:hypothetical protein BC937DRAFT_88019 [Endogone sp. FLAS-F59071]|eukprot:RUS19078.1 hypothetical protein BC937DRAFT_88019 [Endogone sp. FLAS-F59071]